MQAYDDAEKKVTLQRNAFDEAETHYFRANAQQKIEAELELEKIDAAYNANFEKLEKAARKLFEAPAPSVEAVILKIEIAMDQGEGDDLLSFVLADLRRLAKRQATPGNALCPDLD